MQKDHDTKTHDRTQSQESVPIDRTDPGAGPQPAEGPHKQKKKGGGGGASASAGPATPAAGSPARPSKQACGVGRPQGHKPLLSLIFPLPASQATSARRAGLDAASAASPSTSAWAPARAASPSPSNPARAVRKARARAATSSSSSPTRAFFAAG